MEYREKHKERYREYSKKSKRKQREERGEEINAYQREWYRKTADAAKKSNARRLRAYPYRGLRRAIQNCGPSPQELSELIGLLRERLINRNGISYPAKGIGENGGRVHRPEHETNGEERLRFNSNKERGD